MALQAKFKGFVERTARGQKAIDQFGFVRINLEAGTAQKRVDTDK